MIISEETPTSTRGMGAQISQVNLNFSILLTNMAMFDLAVVNKENCHEIGNRLPEFIQNCQRGLKLGRELLDRANQAHDS